MVIIRSSSILSTKKSTVATHTRVYANSLSTNLTHYTFKKKSDIAHFPGLFDLHFKNFNYSFYPYGYSQTRCHIKFCKRNLGPNNVRKCFDDTIQFVGLMMTI